MALYPASLRYLCQGNLISGDITSSYFYLDVLSLESFNKKKQKSPPPFSALSGTSESQNRKSAVTCNQQIGWSPGRYSDMSDVNRAIFFGNSRGIPE
jgi:hypothetical protein